MGNLQKQPQKMFCKKRCFRNFTKFREKHQCQSLSFLIKLQVSGIAFFDTQKDYCFAKLGLKTKHLISTLNMFTHYICQRSYRKSMTVYVFRNYLSTFFTSFLVHSPLQLLKIYFFIDSKS